MIQALVGKGRYGVDAQVGLLDSKIRLNCSATLCIQACAVKALNPGDRNSSGVLDIHDMGSQKTIAAETGFSGKGMHSGRIASVRLFPAKANTGFRFRRLDAASQDNVVKASIDNVLYYPACTCIANDLGVSVRTVEHLLAACYATGIDNLDIEIEGEEVPILDGSAEPIVQLIESSGARDLGASRRLIEITEAVYFQDEHRKFSFEPHDGFAVDINIYPGEYGHMQWNTEMTPELFRQEIVAAKAWGRLKHVWIPKLVGNFLSKPVLRGANLGTAVVYAFGKPINPSGLKYTEDLKRHDMVRHKVLDIIGDLQLLGADIKGKVITHSSAHATNHSGMRELLANADCWRPL